jgi:hypothetical protein
MLLYLADCKMKANQRCKHRHGYGRKRIVAEVEHVESDVSASHYLDPGTSAELQDDML